MNQSYGQRLIRDFRKNKSIYFLAIPIVLFYLIFHYKTMYGAVIAFYNYRPAKGISGSAFVGLDHFVSYFTGPFFWRTLKNTLAISLYNLVFGFTAPIILALMFNEVGNMVFKKVSQTISYLPYFISTVVIVGLVKDFCSVDGVINGIREFFGLNAVSFMTDPKYFRTIFIASNIWQGLGWGTIVYLAALSGVDPQLHEAATLDGANRWQRIRYVSWPAIVPTTTIMLILESGKIISSDFTKVLLLYNESTYETADIIGTYVYREGILGGKFEYTTAIGLLTSLFSFIFLITANFLSKKISDNSLW